MSKEKPSENPQEPANNGEERAGGKSGQKEVGGFADKGLKEPTRYGDWEVGGRCSDF